MYTMRGEVLKEVEVERDLSVLVSKDLKVAEQCLKVSKQGNKMLGVIIWSCSSRDKEVITCIPLYKAVVRPHLKYCAGMVSAFA